MKLPESARHIIDKLHEAGYEAYIVGGCVRDFLMGEDPHDWDMTTSARPEDVKRIFSDFNIIDTGIKHGTVTLMMESEPFEITTYRTDGSYVNSRRPQSVTFVASLREDLRRRDFTINAMAWNHTGGLMDYFGGREDLESGIIRCVGNPDERLSEDALRILRALRFASEKDFRIEPDTYMAMRRNLSLLRNISAERIAVELSRTLMGKGVFSALMNYPEPLFEIIPELRAAFGFKQNNPHHIYDVYEHTLRSIANADADLEIRLALLFHDAGKPLCYSEKEGIGHFYGHDRISADIAEKVLRRLKYDSATVSNAVRLVENHSLELISSEKIVRRRLSKFGEVFFRKLLRIKRADSSATSPDTLGERLRAIEETERIIDKIIEENLCFSVKSLAIDGNDLIRIGIPQGKLIGSILAEVLEMVIDGELENDREKILEFTERKYIVI